MHRSQCILMLLISCTNQKENEPKLEVLYYEAVSVVTLESNQLRLEEEYWIEQIKDPTQSRVVENWTAIDGVSTRYEFNVHSELNFDVLIFLQDQLDSEGVGTYDGIGLDWSYWEYNLIQADGRSSLQQASSFPPSCTPYAAERCKLHSLLHRRVLREKRQREERSLLQRGRLSRPVG